jgi:hypothetical protein
LDTSNIHLTFLYKVRSSVTTLGVLGFNFGSIKTRHNEHGVVALVDIHKTLFASESSAKIIILRHIRFASGQNTCVGGHKFSLTPALLDFRHFSFISELVNSH